MESVEIGLAGILDGELLSLPPPGEVFLPYRKQQQQHDVSPVPLIRASSSSNLDTAVFDFDVDEVDAMIGELVEEHDQEHEQNLTCEKRGQRRNLQQLQQEEGEKQQQQAPVNVERERRQKPRARSSARARAVAAAASKQSPEPERRARKEAVKTL